jgi:hypothetical protein
MSSRACRTSADRLARGAGDRAPLPVVLDGVHELVRDPDGVVGVLVLDRGEPVTVDGHVEARVAQGRGLVLLLGLAPDELADVRVVDVQHDHLRRAPRLAAGLDRPGPRVGAAHERHGPDAVPPLLRGSMEPRMFDRLIPEPEPPRKIRPSRVFQSRIDSIVSSTERMKQAEHCGCSSKPDVEPDGRVERRHLVEQDERELGLEGVAVLRGGEVAAAAAPVGDRAGHAADHLLDRALAGGEPICPRKYFWATMFVAFCDHVAGNSTSACSNETLSPKPIRASRSSHSTESNGCTPGW